MIRFSRKIRGHREPWIRRRAYVEIMQEAFQGLKNAKFVSLGSMFTLHFGGFKPANFEDVKRTDAAVFKKWHAAVLREGFYLSPSRFETCFVSGAHSERQTQSFINTALKILS
jgi:glutamate-1-semialdehyde 2,1-aminomutase